MVKMRLLRMGRKRKPFYRVVVMDALASRDSKYLDLIGWYNPMAENDDELYKIDVEKAKKWISNGVQPTETVASFLKKSGVLEAKK